MKMYVMLRACFVKGNCAMKNEEINKLMDRLMSVCKEEFGIYPSHIQSNVNTKDNSNSFIVIYFGGIRD